MKELIYTCDTCSNRNEVTQEKLQIIFTTDQEEGKVVKPYLTTEKIDICKKCMSKVLNGKAIYGKGSKGQNEYSFKKFK